MKVAEKVAIVTGGAMGMGKGFSEALLRAGAKVCIADVDATAGQTTSVELGSTYGDANVIFVQCDVTSQTDLEGVFQKTKATFGGVHIVINNAGIGGESDAMWERAIDVNVKGVMRGIRLAMHYMGPQGGGEGGVIINIASMAGINPNPLCPVYGCTKAAIIHATRAYAISPGAVHGGIRLNVLCPAFVDTPMTQRLISGDPAVVAGGGSPDIINAFVQKIGIISVEESAEACMELLTDDSRNGAILKVSKAGGRQYCSIVAQDI